MDDNEKQLDIPQEPTFLSYYRSLGLCPHSTYRVFNRGDYYTLHGQNAEFVAKSFLCTTSAIKYIGYDSHKIPSIAISQARYEPLLRHLLIENRFRVEIYKKCLKKKSLNEWELDIKASPGSLGPLEDIIYSTNASIDSRGIVAIQLSSNCFIGIAFVDAIVGKMSFCEFEDNLYLSHLESLLVQISPKECLISLSEKQETDLSKKLKKILELNRILITEVKKSSFNFANLESDLKKLLNKKDKEISLNSMLEKKSNAKEALSATLDYLNLIGDDSNYESFELNEINLKQFVKLDATAVHSLDLFPNTSNESISLRTNKTLFQVLNKCRTLSGQRLLAQFIRQPLTNVQEIEERLDIVEYFIKNYDIRQDLSENYLKKIPDLSRIYKKLHSKRANLQDCYRIYLLLKILPNLKQSLISEDNECCDAIKENFCDKLDNISEELSKLRELLDGVIDEERVETNGEFWIRPDYDDDLKELRNDLNALETKADIIYKSVDKDLRRELKEEKSVVKLETSIQGFVFKLTRKNEKGLRNSDKYIEVKNSTKKDGFRFLNNEMRKLNDKYCSARNEYETLQNDLAQDIIKEAASFSESIKQLESLLTYLDVMVSLACVSLIPSTPYIRPKLLPQGSGKIELKQVRHPCLELQDDISYIPNDVKFDSEDRKFYFITGPNMGGKSTFIRSISLCVLMAQMGSYVPAESATISIVDSIFTRVGAGDKQIKGISTFMAEMIETAAIFRSATKDSLVVIDELGRGTSTYDGFGLAWAISEYIAKEIKAYTLFATHFHELTDLANEIQSVGNLHLSAIVMNNKLTLLYKVNEGICDQSFGINVAELAHFPQHIIEFAKQKLKDFEGLNGTNSSNKELIKEIADEVSKQPNADVNQIKSIIMNKVNKIKT